MHVRNGDSSDERELDDIGMCGCSHLVECGKCSNVVEVEDIDIWVDEDGSRQNVLEHGMVVLQRHVARLGINSEENRWLDKSSDGIAQSMDVWSGL